MAHVSNKEKAKEITKCVWFPHKCTEGDIQNMLMEMAEWKDERFAQEKQQFIDRACEAFCKCECCGNCGEHKLNCIILGDFKQALKGE